MALKTSSDVNRRFFLRQLLATVATVGTGAALSTGLTACSTLDEYLFEDFYDLKDQVLIIGGGLSGLYLAYKLKQNKTEFRLLEGSNRFGGRVRSNQSYDLGASVFSPDDSLLGGLIKEFSLGTDSIDKKNHFLTAGMESLIQTLVPRISGLMPYRNLRLKWRLMSVRKVDNRFELLFQTPGGRRTLVARRVVFAIPPSQWKWVDGLYDLPEMKAAHEWAQTLQNENVVKAVVPLLNGARVAQGKSIGYYEDEAFDVRQIGKKYKNLTWTEIDFEVKEPTARLELQKINNFMRRQMSLAAHFSRLSTENYFDWQTTALIGSAYFRNKKPWVNSNSSVFQVIGDFATTQKPSTMEGALFSALKASEALL